MRFSQIFVASVAAVTVTAAPLPPLGQLVKRYSDLAPWIWAGGFFPGELPTAKEEATPAEAAVSGIKDIHA